MKLLVVGFLLGLVVGVGGMYLAGQGGGNVLELADSPTDAPPLVAATAVDEVGGESEEPAGGLTAPAMAVEEGAVRRVEAEAAPTSTGNTAVLEMMMTAATEEMKAKAAVQVAGFVEQFGLDDAQRQQVEEVMEGIAARRGEAVTKIMQGKAAFEDLIYADEDNYAALDAAMGELLTGEQGELYAAWRDEREGDRIKRKAEEDLAALSGLNLSEAQREQAWEVFAAANADSTPGEVPEGMGMAEFEGWIDLEVAKRIEGLTPILDAEQLAAYRAQTVVYKDMMIKMVAAGTGTPVVE